MKVTVIGGGSTYTPEIIKGFIDRVQALLDDMLETHRSYLPQFFIEG